MSNEIPILDLSDFLAEKPGALEAVAKELRFAAENIGFFFIRGHGVSQNLINATFEASRQFHALGEEEKMALKANTHNIGYMGNGASISRASQVYDGERRTNLVAAFFLKRELPADHPDIVNNKRFRGANQWPANLDGFRETAIAYMDALERLGKSMLPRPWICPMIFSPRLSPNRNIPCAWPTIRRPRRRTTSLVWRRIRILRF